MLKSYLKVFPLMFSSGKFIGLPVHLILTIMLFILSFGKMTAQDNTLYLMPDIPQANQLNPAYFKLCRIYVELPVISSIKLNIRNTAFGFHDAVQRGTGSQSTTYVLNGASLDKRLKAMNFSQLETDINLLGFGFAIDDWYFTFGISNHSNTLLSYPHDIVMLRDEHLLTANTGTTTISLSKTGGEMTVWNSIGVSAAKEISDGLKVGFRVKYLQGTANAVSRHSELLLNYSGTPAALDAYMNYRANTSFPVNVGFAPDGSVSNLNFDNSFNNIIGDYIFNGNRGASVDAGFVYDIDDVTQVSGSFTDLGFIHWRKNSNTFAINRNYNFSAADLAQLQTKPGQIDLVNAVRDSINGYVSGSPKSYYTLTPVKIYGGVTRLLLPKLKAGVMSRIEIYNLHVMPSLTFSLNYIPVPFVAASLSYTIMNNKFNQVGAGIAVGNRIAQFYLVTDNIIGRWTKDFQSSYSWPYNARMFSLRFGINLLFGCHDKQEKKNTKNFKGSRVDLCPAYR
jgi:hypothetical protein